MHGATEGTFRLSLAGIDTTLNSTYIPPIFAHNSRMMVHVTHCCPEHGCKYGEELCPVINKLCQTRYPDNNGCEVCFEHAITNLESGRIV